MRHAAPSSPAIARPATQPSIPRKLFVNLPVADLQRSVRFFEALGFEFHPHFTDATATCMLVGEDAYVMFLTHDRFRGFSKRPIPDTQTTTAALFSLAADSRAAVDAMVSAAVARGATAQTPEDHGFMYESGFHDLDGHGWGVFWMDPKAVPG